MNDGILTLEAFWPTYETLNIMFDNIVFINPMDNNRLPLLGDETFEETSENLYETFDIEKNAYAEFYSSFAREQPCSRLEDRDSRTYIVFSFPLAFDGSQLIVEMSKEIPAYDKSSIAEPLSHISSAKNLIKVLNGLVYTDELTKLYNRRYINKHLPVLLQESEKSNVPLCLALLDLDNFKIINDTYGHLAGDQILTNIASILSGFTRKGNDWVARYGGEEFIIYFSGIDLKKTVDVLERIRCKINNSKIVFDNIPLRITASIGLTESRKGDTEDTLIGRCDKYLYKAKSNGKNRVEYGI